MHKNTPVAELEIDDETSRVSKISNISRPEHLPVGVAVSNGSVDRKALNDWWAGRAIPASRSGLDAALTAMNITSPDALLTKCFGLSLSDQYWVRSMANPVEWKYVNFFENGFSEDVGNALFGHAPEGELDLMSPDNTSDGWLKKKWVIAEGKRVEILENLVLSLAH